MLGLSSGSKGWFNHLLETSLKQVAVGNLFSGWWINNFNHFKATSFNGNMPFLKEKSGKKGLNYQPLPPRAWLNTEVLKLQHGPGGHPRDWRRFGSEFGLRLETSLWCWFFEWERYLVILLSTSLNIRIAILLRYLIRDCKKTLVSGNILLFKQS